MFPYSLNSCHPSRNKWRRKNCLETEFNIRTCIVLRITGHHCVSQSIAAILDPSIPIFPFTNNIFYTPRGGTTTVGSNAPGAFLVFNFFGWSLSPDLQFLLGQTNTRRVFATQVLSDRTIFCTLGEGNGGV